MGDGCLCYFSFRSCENLSRSEEYKYRYSRISLQLASDPESTRREGVNSERRVQYVAQRSGWVGKFVEGFGGGREVVEWE